MTRRSVGLLLVGFLATRGLMVVMTGTSLNITASAPDISLYSSWAEAMSRGAAPYSEIPIEYPPGSLPFLLAAKLLGSGIHYRTAFTAVMVVLDVVGFVGLLLIATRRGTPTGPWVWVIAVFLLGPVVYLRLDLIPAVATIWAIERAAGGAAGVSGALFAFGAAAKLYPALLMPVALWNSLGRKRFLLGGAIVAGVALLPFAFALGDLWDSVLGYHGSRGIQIESSWAAALAVAARRGYDAALVYSFGSFQFDSPISPTLEVIATVLSVAVVVAGTWFVVRRVTRDDTGPMAVGLYGILAIVMVTGTVLSPQFVVWLIALAAAALCFQIPAARTPLLLIIPIAALTQLEFPRNYNALKAGDLEAILLLIARNLLMLGSGVSALLALRASPGKDP